MATPYRIQEFRCRLSPDAFTGERIAYLTFPYHQALKNFLGHMSAIRGRKVDRSDEPPFESLNRLLGSLTPSLVHAFIPYYEKAEGEERQVFRRMMVFKKSPSPSLKQIERVVRVWVRRWAEYRFAKELKTRDGQDAYSQLLTQLSSPETQWEDVDASTLVHDIQNPLSYKAIPSLLAARLTGEISDILGTEVKWQLTQEAGSNRFALVSQPVLSSYYYDWKDKTVTGYFAYHVEFNMQTVPGDPEPFIYINISCRRYVERPVRDLLFQRRSTVMVGTQTPRLADWPVDPTLVPIRIRGVKKHCWWEDRVTELLDDLRARPLADIQQIVADPKAYWEPNEHTGDRYLILHAEGIRPNHPLENGFSPVELYAVWQACLLLCKGILLSEPPIERDQQTQRLERTASMLPIWRLNKEARRVITFDNDKKKHSSLDDQKKQQMGIEAMTRALSGRSLTLYILYRTQQTYDELFNLVRGCVLWPDSAVTVTSLRIDDALTTPLEHGNLNPDDMKQPGLSREEKEAREKQWEIAVEAGRRKRVKEWRTFLATLPSTSGVAMALIELPPESVERDDLNPRGAIREACVREHIGSQMLVSLTDGEAANESRAKSALADLLVRQTGTLYGNVTDMYQLAGLPAALASQVTVVGLCRVRSKTHRLDYTVAVRVLPGGKVEMQLPESQGHWQSYFEGCLALGETFRTAPIEKNKHRKELKLKDETIKRFIQRICLEREGPTVVFIGAQNFRSVWKQLQNPLMTLNELSFAQNDNLIRPDLVPDLWIFRLREAGSLGETPQYVRLLEGDLPEDEDVHYAEGLYERGSSGAFHVYHSIGRGPTSSKQSPSDLKSERGGTTSFKHQHVLEEIPFFQHDTALSLPLARIAYFFRFIPSWEQGTTMFPFPNHLGYDAIDDYLCLLPSSQEDDEV